MAREFRLKLQRVLRNRTVLGIGGLLCLTFSTAQVQSIRRHRSPQPLWVLELAQSVEELTQSRSDSALFEIRSISQKHNLPITSYLVQGQKSKLPEDVQLTVKSQTGLSTAEVRNWFSEGAVREYITRSAMQGCEQAQLQMSDLKSSGSAEYDHAFIKTYGGSYEQVVSGTWFDAWRNEPMSTFPLCPKATFVSELVTIDFANIVKTEVESSYGYKMPHGEEVTRLLSDASSSIRALIQSSLLLGLSLTSLVAILIALGRESTLLPTSDLLKQLIPEECIAELFFLRRRMEEKKISQIVIRLRFLREILSLLLVFHIRIRVENLLLPTKNKIDD